MSSDWLAISVAAIFTFATRLSFIALSGRWTPSRKICRVLQFVPVAVLCAIIAPEVFSPAGTIMAPLANPRIPAAALAILIAWQWRSTLGAIAAGMVLFWLLKL